VLLLCLSHGIGMNLYAVDFCDKLHNLFCHFVPNPFVGSSNRFV
jgi:hypothetical protein